MKILSFTGLLATLVLIISVDVAMANCAGYGIVSRDSGYSWDVKALGAGNVAVKIPTSDRNKLEKVSVQFGNGTNISLATEAATYTKGNIPDLIKVLRKPGSTHVFLVQWWEGTLPDGHGEICTY